MFLLFHLMQSSSSLPNVLPLWPHFAQPEHRDPEPLQSATQWNCSHSPGVNQQPDSTSRDHHGTCPFGSHCPWLVAPDHMHATDPTLPLGSHQDEGRHQPIPLHSSPGAPTASQPESREGNAGLHRGQHQLQGPQHCQVSVHQGSNASSPQGIQQPDNSSSLIEIGQLAVPVPREHRARRGEFPDAQEASHFRCEAVSGHPWRLLLHRDRQAPPDPHRRHSWVEERLPHPPIRSDQPGLPPPRDPSH
jgi:hypothetical protein